MDKTFLTFGDIEIEKNEFCRIKILVFIRYKYWEEILYPTRFLLVKKTVNTLLVTCIMIIKLSHYIQCFVKQVLM